MKRFTKKILYLIIACMLTVSSCLTTVHAEDAVTEGWSFSLEERYKADKIYDKQILTYEATISLPKDLKTRGGVILGTFIFDTYKAYNFEITTNGRPRVYYVNANAAVIDYTFNSVNVCTGEWLHLAVVRNKSMNQMQCYVDGELKQSLPILPEDSGKIIPTVEAVVGGDLRLGNDSYFKGRIRDVKVYADARTAAEVKSDMTSLDKADLIACYDFNNVAAGSSNVKDESGNGYDLHLQTRWLTTRPNIEPYDYSFAVIGDTQIVNRSYNDKLCKIYDYICNNAESSKIKFAFGLGDITDLDSEKEWDQAKTQLHKMDSVVPYTVLRGNHDSVEKINQYFPYSDYESKLGGSYNGGIENTWQTLTVGDIKYLIMVLDWAPADAVLDWAAGVIADHPTHNVILTSHIFTRPDGTIDSTQFTGDANNAKSIWDKLVSKHENIVLVISGHYDGDDVIVRQEQGAKDTTVTHMLVNPQGLDAKESGGTGLVAMLYFSEGGSKVQVEYYSTIQEKWFSSDNQFTFDLAVVGGKMNLLEDEADKNADADKDASNTNQANQEGPNMTIIIVAGVAVLVVVAAVVGIIVSKKRKSQANQASEN